MCYLLLTLYITTLLNNQEFLHLDISYFIERNKILVYSKLINMIEFASLVLESFYLNTQFRKMIM